jgi:hypothetical protein
MMLRGNLATRPFYNERMVGLLLALVGVVVVALTIYNGSRLLQLSARRSELRAQMAEDESNAERIRKNAVAVQSSVDRAALTSLAGSAREANSLIDARTFSWTTFLAYIEETIPMGVRLNAVSPEFSKDDIVVTMLLVGRNPEDVDRFMKALEGTGAFYDVSPTVGSRTEDGMERVTIQAYYLPPKPSPATPAAAAPAPAPAAATPEPATAPKPGGGR